MSSTFQTQFASLRVALAGIAALTLSACGKASDQASVATAAEASASGPPTAPLSGVAPTPDGGLVIAAPTDVKASPAGTAVSQGSNAAAQAIADNAKVTELARQFEADPAAIARQNSQCGPADQVVNNLYAVSHGAETDELRRFRIACMAKDLAKRDIARKAATASGGVTNTNSL